MKSENSCGLLLRQINNSLEKRANNDLRARDLTLAQVSALLSIQKTKEKQVTFKELLNPQLPVLFLDWNKKN